MALWKNGAFVEDQWRAIEDGEDAPPNGHVILPLSRWTQNKAAFEGSNAPLGLRVQPGAPIETYASDLHRFEVIALAFPKFGDGRAFSTARLLRERYNYRGQIRAVGDVLIDQIQMMERCGFDAFEIGDPKTEKLLRERGAPAYTRFYQPGLGAETGAGTRPWARRQG